MIYRVSLASRTTTRTGRPEKYFGLGGRGLTSAIIAAEVSPRVWPLGPGNKLVLAPGLLVNSGASSTGRLSVGAKSPLTGTIKESNVGGPPGQQLARLGVDALIFEEPRERDQWLVARVSTEGVEVLPGDHLAGLGVYESVAHLRDQFGDKVAVFAIGLAGEHRLAAANIGVTDADGVPARHAGRGGLGAVMGSLGLKAIVVDTTDAPTAASPADPEGLKAANRRFVEALRAHPVSGQSMPKYGTNALVSPINALAGLPTRNFSQGQFELAEQINGDALHDRIVERGGETTHRCMPGCVIRCSNTYMDEAGREVTRGFEYESIVLLGADCGIGDLDAVAQLNYLCDDLGLDTMEVGVTLGVAMEAGVLAFGDAQAALALVAEVGQNTPLGRVVGQGAAVTGRVFGVAHVPVVKGQAMPAYDPRAFKGIGVTYATSTMGADHTAGNCLPGSALPDGTIPDPHSREHQVELSRYMQQLATTFDSLGLCWFTRGPILADNSLLTDILAAQWGGEWTMDGLFAQARKTLGVELAFNRAAGFTPDDDRLPDYFSEEALAPEGFKFDISPEEMQQAIPVP